MSMALDDTELLARRKRVRLETDRMLGVDFARRPCPVSADEPEPQARAKPRRRTTAKVLTQLEQLASDTAGCRKCILSETRTHLVFGEGNPKAELMFVGEAPGADEDRRGRPFVGRAGGLLGRIIEAMGYGREDVYIANVLKCRPPGNRNPSPAEVTTCLPILLEQMNIIDPLVVVAMGRHALQALTGDSGGRGITSMRGTWVEARGRRIMPTFHPAYLLRNEKEKRRVWEDMKQVLKALGKSVPGMREKPKSP